MSEHHLSDVTFASLDLPESVQQGLADCGFGRCTDIQALSLPVLLEERDIAGQAQTGTGKTAAFLLAIFTHLLRHPPAEGRKPNQPRAFVLAPTRELAIQIHKDAVELGKHTGFKLALAYGGTGYDKQRQDIADGVDLLVGTPGRLIDYFKQHVYDLRCVQVAVLDEADRMFDLGFINDVRYLFRRMPPPEQRLSMLFSATLSHRVLELAYEHMDNPESLVVETDSVTAEMVHQVAYYPAMDEKVRLLVGLLRKLQPPRSMVFVNTKRVADRILAHLLGNDVHAAVLSGDVPQRKRQQLLQDFLEGSIPVLIATDVAARGLHIPDVSHVFNYDLPQQAEDYVHRIGRTARAGASGDAISFACEEYAFSLPEIEDYIGERLPVEAINAELLPVLKRPVKLERRPRDTRRGRDDKPSPRGRRDGGGGRRRHPGPPAEARGNGGEAAAVAGQATAQEAPQEAPQETHQATNGQQATTASDGEAPKKRRRRRRRKPASDGAPTAAASSAADSPAVGGPADGQPGDAG